MKKIFIAVSLFLILFLSWYLVLPAFIVIEADEVSPLDVQEILALENNSQMKKLSKETNKKITDKNEEPFNNKKIILQGNFIAQDHEVKGKAILISGLTKKTLRFENFETTNGPNLHIYLSTDLEANDFVDLGKIKATKGNVNYEVDSSIDLKRYNKVLVWCVPFKVLFSYAELT